MVSCPFNQRDADNYAPASRAQSAQPDQDVYDRLDAHLEAKLQQVRIPGLAIGVVQGDEIVYQRGYGLAGTTSSQVTPQTPFIPGSVSKGVTALAVMQLVEAEKLALDAPVKRYLAWFEPTDITVRHLLNQTSGFTARIMGKGGKQGKILFPVILLLAVAAFNLVGLPNLFGIPIRGMLLFSELQVDIDNPIPSRYNHRACIIGICSY